MRIALEFHREIVSEFRKIIVDIGNGIDYIESVVDAKHGEKQ